MLTAMLTSREFNLQTLCQMEHFYTFYVALYGVIVARQAANHTIKGCGEIQTRGSRSVQKHNNNRTHKLREGRTLDPTTFRWKDTNTSAGWHTESSRDLYRSWVSNEACIAGGRAGVPPSLCVMDESRQRLSAQKAGTQGLLVPLGFTQL